MADIAELGFVVDSNPVNKAADNLNKLIPAAAGAERATDKFNKTAAAGKSIVAQMAAGVRNVGTAVGSMARSLPGVAGMLDRTASAFKRVTASAVDADDALMSTRGNVANLAAQFQDIGVTAQMGMSPMMIALQQGTQFSAALQAQGGGAVGALKAIGSAFVSVLSPVSLVTIALVGLLAAGLQFVQWGKVIEKVLDTVADGLVTIAPFAVAGAAALALYYTPAMLGGIATLTGLLAGLAVQAVKTGAAMLAANPVGAIILGIGLVIAAVVVFRDQIKQMLGVDVVQIMQDAANYAIGAFVGAFKGITLIWSNLPAVMGDLTISAVNLVLAGVTQLLNDSRAQVMQFLSWVATVPLPGVNSAASVALGAMANSGEFTAPQIDNPNKGAAGAVAGAVVGGITDAMGVDYVGGFVTFVQDGASGAADALRGLADQAGAMGTEVDKAGKKAADAYRKVTDSAHNFILEQQTEAAALGKTEQQANTLRYAQQLLAQATADGATITAAQRNELLGLAGQMAAAEAATTRLTEAYEFGKQTLGSFFSDFKSELMNGTSIWGAFAQAGINALSSIADKALEMAANGVWDMIFNAFTGSMGGGGGNWVSSITGSSGGIWGLNGFASGGYTGDTGKSQPAGVVHGQEFVMNSAATRRIGVDTLNAMNDNRPVSMGGGNSYSIEFAPQYNLNGLGLTAAEAQEMIRASNEQLLDGLPDVIQTIQADPRKRVVRAE